MVRRGVHREGELCHRAGVYQLHMAAFSNSLVTQKDAHGPGDGGVLAHGAAYGVHEGVERLRRTRG